MLFYTHTYPYSTSCLEAKIPGNKMSWGIAAQASGDTHLMTVLAGQSLAANCHSSVCKRPCMGPGWLPGKCFWLMQPLGAALGCSDKRAQAEWAEGTGGVIAIPANAQAFAWVGLLSHNGVIDILTSPNRDSWICNWCVVATSSIVPAAPFADLNSKTSMIQLQTLLLTWRKSWCCTHVH